jgi:CARDB
VALAAALSASLPLGAQGVQCRGPNDDVGDPCADLAISPEIDYVVDGFTITFLVDVVNGGEVASPESSVAITALQLEGQAVSVGAIEPGQSRRVRISARVPRAAQGKADRVTFTVDPDGLVPEPNEDDNRRTRSIILPTAAVVTDTVTTTVTVTETEQGGTGTVTETVTQTETETETETVSTGSSGGSDDALTWILLGTGLALAVLGGAAAIYGLRARRRVASPHMDDQPWIGEAAPPAASPPAAPPTAAAPPPTSPSAAPPPVAANGGGRRSGGTTPEPVAGNGGGAEGVYTESTEEVYREGAEPPTEAPERYVSTGFADAHEPGTPLSPTTALQPGARYLFWLEVGALVEGSIEETPVELTEIAELPAESRLDVVLFRVGDEESASKALAQGELRIAPDGSVVVSRQHSDELDLRDAEHLRERRLFFPVETPATEGTVQLRCSIYHKQVLLQSRLVTARVVDSWGSVEDALRSELDFTLAPRLDPGHLSRIPEYSLSVLLNQGEDGTHSLTVKGKRFSDAATFDPVELENLVGRARKALRKAAWDSEDPWKEGVAYRYLETSPEKLRRDLATLAVWGIRFYAAICDRLAGDNPLEDLEEAMRAPGFVQIALKQSPRHLLPAAMLYDHLGLSDTADLDEYDLCTGFLEALAEDAPLGDSPCFQGDCPSRGSAKTVCPSGFWGYRHALGIPATLQGAPDAPLEIEYQGQPSLSVAVSTDPQFVLRADHEEALRALRPDLRYAASLADTLSLLEDPSGQVLYFYCHGGLDKDVPYFRVGATTEEPITAVTLLNQRIRWDEPRPLVFLNGCHTTGLEPELALEFVSALVRRSRAAGVVGTEITVFEPLARAFAEDCLRRFLAGDPLGWAVRDSRLALLKAGNPLGLVYLPYALPSLKLVAR